jgi:RNA polymerase sigma factor (sigma-70 family)
MAPRHVDEPMPLFKHSCDELPPVQCTVSSSESSVADLFGRYRAPLMRYFIRHGFPPDVAEDCVQDVFVRIAQVDLKKVENTQAYFFMVASSVAIDHARKMRSRSALRHDSIDAIADFELPPSRVIEGRDDLVRLRAILDELKPRTREIFLLNRLDGLTYTQLAARFGLSVAAIEKQMSKALEHIRRRFSSYE